MGGLLRAVALAYVAGVFSAGVAAQTNAPTIATTQYTTDAPTPAPSGCPAIASSMEWPVVSHVRHAPEVRCDGGEPVEGMQTARSRHAAVMGEGFYAVVGGVDGLGDAVRDIEVFSNAEGYLSPGSADTTGHAGYGPVYERTVPLPQGAAAVGVAAAMLGSALVIAGGMDVSGGHSDAVLVYCVGPPDGMMPLPEGVPGLAMPVADASAWALPVLNTVAVVGGVDDSGAPTGSVTFVRFADGGSGTCASGSKSGVTVEPGPPLNVARARLTLTAHGSMLLALGGYEGFPDTGGMQEMPSPVLEVLDAAYGDKWVVRAAISSPPVGIAGIAYPLLLPYTSPEDGSAKMAVAGGEVVRVGEYLPVTVNKDIVVYSLDEDAWAETGIALVGYDGESLAVTAAAGAYEDDGGGTGTLVVSGGRTMAEQTSGNMTVIDSLSLAISIEHGTGSQAPTDWTTVASSTEAPTSSEATSSPAPSGSGDPGALLVSSTLIEESDGGSTPAFSADVLNTNSSNEESEIVGWVLIASCGCCMLLVLVALFSLLRRETKVEPEKFVAGGSDPSDSDADYSADEEEEARMREEAAAAAAEANAERALQEELDAIGELSLVEPSAPVVVALSESSTDAATRERAAVARFAASAMSGQATSRGLSAPRIRADAGSLLVAFRTDLGGDIALQRRLEGLIASLHAARMQVFLNMGALMGLAGLARPPALVHQCLDMVCNLLGAQNVFAKNGFQAANFRFMNRGVPLGRTWKEIQARLRAPRNGFHTEVESCDLEGVLILQPALNKARVDLCDPAYSRERVLRVHEPCAALRDWCSSIVQLADAAEGLSAARRKVLFSAMRNPDTVRAIGDMAAASDLDFQTRMQQEGRSVMGRAQARWIDAARNV